MQYASAGHTDRGVIRPTNQDALLERPESGIWVVADGMGGHEQGELASRMVCDGLLNLQPRMTVEATSLSVQHRLSDINSRLHRMATRLVAPIRTGTTVVALVMQATRCEVIWAGDSRAYRLRGGELALLTKDHVWAGFSGRLGENSSTITRAVGGEARLELDTWRGEVLHTDRYLLCSDGISRALHGEMIRRCLLEPTLRAATHALIEEAIGAGSSDNVTAVVIEATQ
jgi:serine/threonine protein phosphatase PrpC